jgi:hypothetical protein
LYGLLYVIWVVVVMITAAVAMTAKKRANVFVPRENHSQKAISA